MFESLPFGGWGVGIAVVLVLSWGFRERDELLDDGTDARQSAEALARPAVDDTKRAGGFLLGFAAVVAAVTGQLASVGHQLLAMGGDVLAAHSIGFGWAVTTLLGWFSANGWFDITPAQFLVAAVVVGLLAFATKEGTS
ncbi:hypothetical protein [Halocalculus aciditolerans]|uniref:Uncharacterized protein n=1 Tax=Halocalculus aciditolerans TaxID=1383812 RepID=A0A830FGJ8_9EURY|nr:hypothetical protein [Halocalculus aciditolerans]GGL73410.1 hypothetical protein GCM10009039_34400 [Halocalculus aciditolerans]